MADVILLVYVIALALCSLAWRFKPSLRRFAIVLMIGMLPPTLLWLSALFSPDDELYYSALRKFSDFFPLLGEFSSPMEYGFAFFVLSLISFAMCLWTFRPRRKRREITDDLGSDT